MLCIIAARVTVKPNHTNQCYLSKTTELPLCRIYSFASVVSAHLWWQTQVIAALLATCNLQKVPIECFCNVFLVYLFQDVVISLSLWRALSKKVCTRLGRVENASVCSAAGYSVPLIIGRNRKHKTKEYRTLVVIRRQWRFYTALAVFCMSVCMIPSTGGFHPVGVMSRGIMSWIRGRARVTTEEEPVSSCTVEWYE